MNNFLKFLVGILAFAVWPSTLNAQTFTCAVSQNVPYCQYTGKLKNVYINEGNLMLLSFEQSVDISIPASVGYTGVTNGSAGMYTTTANPSFAEFLYSTALTAFASEKPVTMQFRGAAGYMKIDRIWVQH